MTRHIRALAFACAIVGAAGSAWAQAPNGGSAVVSFDDTEDPTTRARFHVGILHFTPALAITNVGVDSNVFNSATDPRQDTTAGVGPIVNLFVRMRRARLSGSIGGQYLYFKTYANQRAWNTANSLRFELPLSRIRPFVTGGYLRTRDRSGYEVDSRLQQSQATWSSGVAIRLGARASLTLDGGQQFIRFDSNQIYRQINIADALNRRTDTQRAQFAKALTPLTTWVVNVETIQDRFVGDRARNADSVRATTGFELKPAALIAGRAVVGYRRFNVLDSAAPDYQGLVASASASMVLGRARFSLTELRDVSYAFDRRFPFAVQTTTAFEAQRRLGRAWDVVGRTTLNLMSYRAALASDRERPVDRAVLYGGGLGYTVGRTLRVGLNGDSVTRTTQSSLTSDYSGFRVGLSLSYGLSQ